MLKLLTKVFGTKTERELKSLWPIVEEINQHYEEFKDVDLIQKTEEFKKRIANGETLDELMPEAFAAVKEACRRLVGKKWPVVEIETEWRMIPFDVQLIGAIVLHQGRIAEMKTGEGKTLVATMPMYLNALTGKGAHLVTVNDYLARRDREWMGPVYESVGLTIGVIQGGMDNEMRKQVYQCDITYGTNNEFGFDYLRDNMTWRWEDKVQRTHHYAIVDEVDSILIDEARTPLIISGPVEHETSAFNELNPIVNRLNSAQTVLINRIVAEAKKLFDEDPEKNEKELGFKLLQARRGSPKNRQLLKLEQETGIKKLIETTELKYVRDKSFAEIDNDLYFVIDEQTNVIDLTDKGINFIAPNNPDMFVLPDLSSKIGVIDKDEGMTPKETFAAKEKAYQEYAQKSEKLANLRALLKGYSLFEKDVEYVLQDGRVIIVDQFTGRLMPGRRFSDGLHQAIEAKEGVRVQEETQTFATVTIQNYFRMYEKLAGMTGTAATEANEFWEIYKLDVVEIPTMEPVRRIDYEDIIYRSRREKYNAIIDEIVKWYEKKRPILVGTTSVDVSEVLSKLLQRRGVSHEVLNAKHHQREAVIIASAGQPGAVTIATNMAGRGTDIKLGEKVVECSKCCIKCLERDCASCTHQEKNECLKEVPCGLYIIGTERHEARRIDNQLRGRSGRQGDPGSTRFFLSLEDNLMRIFGSDRVAEIMDRFGGEEQKPLTHPLVTRAIANAQKRVEENHFEVRKHLLEYDNVMNRQREYIYKIRDEILKGENLQEKSVKLFEDAIEDILLKHTNPKTNPENWDWEAVKGEYSILFLTDFTIDQEEIMKIKQEALLDLMLERARERLTFREQELGAEVFNDMLKFVLMHTLDSKWRDHLYGLDALREGIRLRAYAQKDPLIEYKQEAFRMYDEMLIDMAKTTSGLLFRAQPGPQVRRPQKIQEHKPGVSQPAGAVSSAAPANAIKKVGRNDPCPCGSGKKYKKCCGKNVS
ncbi:preprotein translocase subunit SecA [candidate division WOR-3 bacterium RBG_13_43_14]|uniref:Protein translocase subunit SecA n=1 Tax=candidate division WOR-3 bacterium RBG_13_43_14 TaxID=1802590 RepID=A0A1F4UC42_UNCW3|nr:MAG: preprotein translocase subunit SecA [candidate division WOR-3 bacterium RBG_13_43_14]